MLPANRADDPGRSCAAWDAPRVLRERDRSWPWLLGLLAYGLLLWCLFGGDPIAASWREADTQAMARNLLASGFDVLHPRVDWRGAGEGAVECEFPLYQGIVAAALWAFGDVEWPGRLVSLVSLLAVATALFRLLERAVGTTPAAVGTAAFLCGGQASVIGTRVMPDAFSAALALCGTLAFVRFLEIGRTRLLVVASLATTLGALAKPTALQLLLVQFVVAWLAAPQRLRELRTWLGAAVVVVAVAGWMLHARRLGLESGLTFGVTFGDTKTPGLEHLVRPGLYRGIVMTTLDYGLSWFGAVAIAVLLWRRDIRRFDIALLVIAAMGLVGTMRYSYSAGMGPQYHLIAALVGAWLVARAFAACRARWCVPVVLVVAVGTAVFHLQRELATRRAARDGSDLTTAAALREHAGENELVVLRGPKPAMDEFWKRPNNFEAPVLFYQSRRRGWILPTDGVSELAIRERMASGARWYVESLPTDGDVEAWLGADAREVWRSDAARIVRLGR